MQLAQLIETCAQRPKLSVPAWMLGFYKRHSISFANGMTDTNTHVCWLQSRNFSIDLRLPTEEDQVVHKQLTEYNAEELQQLANYEGWLAASDWDGNLLSWQEATATFQVHNRWLEPAILKRVGNCMMEFSPSDAYVEDWRLQPSASGPLIGLHLLEERDLSSGKIRHKGGGLIVCGDYAGLVLGRGQELPDILPGTMIKGLVAKASGNADLLASLFNFETSVAQGSLQQGFKVTHSTKAGRLGQDLLPLDGFERIVPNEDGNLAGMEIIRQQLSIEGRLCERIFSVDTLEPNISFNQSTASTTDADAWFKRESTTMARYAKVLR